MLTGYTNRLSARGNEQIDFKVSTDATSIDVTFVRLEGGDPVLKEIGVFSSASGNYPGQIQELHPGSYAVVPDWNSMAFTGDFTAGAWIFPTLLKETCQSVLSDRDSRGNGFETGLTENGKPYARIGDQWLVAETALVTHRWYHFLARFSDGRLEITARQHKRDFNGLNVQAIAEDYKPATLSSATLKFAAGDQGTNCFNGKISDPFVVVDKPDNMDYNDLAYDFANIENLAGVAGAWDFGQGINTQTFIDLSGNNLNGILMQLPVRAVTGPQWLGQTENPALAPRLYAAIHFHEDSLSDAQWDTSFSLTVPDDWDSGVYAARLSAEGNNDYLPFAVLPPQGSASARTAFLFSTFTYLAYSTQKHGVRGLNCLYDKYADGAGVPFASLHHPLPNVRPSKGLLHSTDSKPFSRHLNADLGLLEWLVTVDLNYDVITDHDLHREGVQLLSPYDVVVTGSHPEYVSTQILDSLESYLDAGGSLMYLGGNGFYWVTDLSDDETVIEVRRTGGTRPWTSEPGESRQQFSGDMAGLWRGRGRAPQRLTGVGYTAQGWTTADQCGLAMPYIQTLPRPASAPDALFQGIGRNERIGDFPSLGLGNGAAGDEIDRADVTLGTPPNAVILASATGFPTAYRPAIEEQRRISNGSLDADDLKVRSDIVWFETGSGGAVFSTGSINWISSLTFNGSSNTVSTLTYNALTHLLAIAPN